MKSYGVKPTIFIITAICLLLVMLAGSGCSGTPPTSYALLTHPVPGDCGSVISSPMPESDGKYQHGTRVTLEARASTMFCFVRWSGDAQGTMNPTVVTIDRDKNVFAEFQKCEIPAPPISFPTINPVPATLGTTPVLTTTPPTVVKPAPTSSAVPPPATVTLPPVTTVIPPPVTVTLPPATTVVPPPVIVTLPPTTTVIPPPVTVTAPPTTTTTPSLTVNFDGWYIGSNKVNTATKSSTVIARVSLSGGNSGQYQLRIRRDISWSEDVTINETLFNHNGIQTIVELSFTPPNATDESSTNGYHVDLLKDGNNLWTLDDAYPPRLSVSVPSYSLTTSSVGNGSVNLPSGSHKEGTQVTVTATPAACYKFDSWSGDASGTNPTVNITMNSNKTVTANFSKIRYTLTTSVNGSGSVSPNGGTYDCGQTITLSATPASGYTFDHWAGDVSGTSPVNIIMNSNRNVIAYFKEIPHSTITFDYTGSIQQWVIPAGINSINVDVRGAQGGESVSTTHNGGPGGPGGRVQSIIAVTPGETLYVYVGGKGSSSGVAGFNGGGASGSAQHEGGGPVGGGGGASDIRKGGTSLNNRVVVAGGGGGSRMFYTPAADGPYGGGLGGGLTGGNGPDCSSGSKGGKGGAQTSGGAGGAFTAAYGESGSAGSSGQGGKGGNYSANGYAGAGGGGGYYGGGGGAASSAGGGGGSSYSSGTNTSHTPGFQTGNGIVIISY